MNALDILYPRGKCVACGEDLRIGGGLCEACRDFLPGLRASPHSNTHDHAYSTVYSPYEYRGCTRAMILALKFRAEARPATEYLIPAMASAAEELASHTAVPVPLSKERMLERGYNQAALLALGVARFVGFSVRENLLWRNRQTERQMSLTRDKRDENVRGAFSASRGVRGKSILLIDDVLTTGATASACAAALLAAGAAKVDVLTAARVAHADLQDDNENFIEM